MAKNGDPAKLTDAELALAAGEAADVIGDLTARIEEERAWMLRLLREIAQRAGVAPTPFEPEA